MKLVTYKGRDDGKASSAFSVKLRGERHRFPLDDECEVSDEVAAAAKRTEGVKVQVRDVPGDED